MTANELLEKMTTRHHSAPPVRRLQRLIENKKTRAMLETRFRELGATHSFLGFVFEAMVGVDPTLPPSPRRCAKLVQFLCETLERDPERLLDTAPLGHAPDHLWFEVHEQEREMRLVGLGETKLSSHGISADQLIEEEHVVLQAISSLLERPDLLARLTTSYDVTIDPGISKRIILPQGTNHHSMTLPAGWNIVSSVFTYLDVIETAEFLTGESLGTLSARPGDLKTARRERFAHEIADLFLSAARHASDAFPDFAALDAKTQEETWRNIAATLFMGYIKLDLAYYQKPAARRALVRTLIHNEPTAPASEEDAAIASVIHKLLGEDPRESLRAVCVAKEYGTARRDVLRVNRLDLLPIAPN